MFAPDISSIDQRCALGPFDIIGDVHGCFDELSSLLAKLGYGIARPTPDTFDVTAPKGRQAIFVGDYTDRGPNAPDVLRLVMAMVARGTARAIPGNHDVKLNRWLKGHQVTMTHGLDLTVAQLAGTPDAFRAEVSAFLDHLPTYLWLDGGALVVSHAGLQSTMIGRVDRPVLSHSIYGDTDGSVDASGLAVRYNWAARYDGEAFVVYGHMPVPEVTFVNNTAAIDTACVFGNALSALQWPERRIVSVPAQRVYCPTRRPFGLPSPRPERTLTS